MNLDTLKQSRADLQQQFTNLSSPEWVSQQLNQLKGKYEILNQVISAYEKEQADAASIPADKPANSVNDKRK